MNSANYSDLNGRHFHNEPIFTLDNLVFDHRDLSETCRNVSEIFKPHGLKILHQKGEFSAVMHHVKTGTLSICQLEYGADVVIEPDHLDRFYLIQIPTQGYAEIEFGQQKFISYPEVASLISPEQSLRMRWHANSPQLILKIAKDDLTYHVRQHNADMEGSRIVFDPKLDFKTSNGMYFLQLLRTMIDALACEQHPLHHPLVFKQFESSLLNALIYGQPNNAVHQIIDRVKEKVISPYFVKRTQEFIHEHLHEPLNIEVLAEYAGVSVRTLFAGFKNYLGTTPMAYLKELRYEQAHFELMHTENVSVTDVAFKWGFTHLGRFSQEYKHRYGELPSSTLRCGQMDGSFNRVVL